MFCLPFLQYVYYGVKQSVLGHVRILTISTLILAILFVGCEAYFTSYFDFSPYWGTLVCLKLTDDTTVVALTHEQLQEKIALILTEVQMLALQVKDMKRQQKVLYNKLFGAIVALEQQSHLHPDLIDKIGPLANINLKNFSKTDEVLVAAATYEANLPLDSPLRNLMSDLRASLMETNKTKLKFLKRIAQYHIDNPIVMKYSLPIYMTPEPVYDEQLGEYIQQEPVLVVESSPSRSWNISEADAWLLWKGHHFMVDIDLVQAKMAKNTLEIVHKYQLLDKYQEQLKLQEDPSLRVASTPVTFIFMQNKSRGYIKVNDPIYRCRLGVLWCSRVGTIIGFYDQPRQATHPTSGALVDGFLVEVELFDKSAGAAKVLHVNRPTSH